MVDRYTLYASKIPNVAACRDRTESYNWAQLHAVTNRLALNLIDMGLTRDATALVQIPSSCREFILRIGLKKAGIIGAFAPMQWGHQELEYTSIRVKPSLVIMDRALMGLRQVEQGFSSFYVKFWPFSAIFWKISVKYPPLLIDQGEYHNRNVYANV